MSAVLLSFEKLAQIEEQLGYILENNNNLSITVNITNSEPNKYFLEYNESSQLINYYQISPDGSFNILLEEQYDMSVAVEAVIDNLVKEITGISVETWGNLLENNQAVIDPSFLGIVLEFNNEIIEYSVNDLIYSTVPEPEPEPETPQHRPMTSDQLLETVFLILFNYLTDNQKIIELTFYRNESADYSGKDFTIKLIDQNDKRYVVLRQDNAILLMESDLNKFKKSLQFYLDYSFIDHPNLSFILISGLPRRVRLARIDTRLISDSITNLIKKWQSICNQIGNQDVLKLRKLAKAYKLDRFFNLQEMSKQKLCEILSLKQQWHGSCTEPVNPITLDHYNDLITPFPIRIHSGTPNQPGYRVICKNLKEVFRFMVNGIQEGSIMADWLQTVPDRPINEENGTGGGPGYRRFYKIDDHAVTYIDEFSAWELSRKVVVTDWKAVQLISNQMIGFIEFREGDTLMSRVHGQRWPIHAIVPLEEYESWTYNGLYGLLDILLARFPEPVKASVRRLPLDELKQFYIQQLRETQIRKMRPETFHNEVYRSLSQMLNWMT